MAHASTAKENRSIGMANSKCCGGSDWSFAALNIAAKENAMIGIRNSKINRIIKEYLGVLHFFFSKLSSTHDVGVGILGVLHGVCVMFGDHLP